MTDPAGPATSRCVVALRETGWVSNDPLSGDLSPAEAPEPARRAYDGVHPPADWKRADCLGCGRRVVRARDAWVEVGGTRTGSYLVTWGAEPLRAFSTDPDRVPAEPLFLLGVAHQGCLQVARTCLEAGTAALPEVLPALNVELGEGVPEPEYTLHPPAAPDACPFCDSTLGLTDEHVWPDWYSRLLRSRGVPLARENVRRGRIDVTVPVCGACNNAWMSVLEKDAARVLKPMIEAGEGECAPFTVTAAERERLASWAVLKAYLLDAATGPCVPRGFLHRFALRREPDESTAVWVGAYTPDVAARGEKRTLNFSSRQGRTENSPNGFLVTFTVFNVLFQVVAHFNGGPVGLTGGRPQYDAALFGLWTAPGSGLVWPPAAGFSRASWDDLVASISDGADA